MALFLDRHNDLQSTNPLAPNFKQNPMNMLQQNFFTKLQPILLAKADGEQFNDFFRSQQAKIFQTAPNLIW